METDTPFHELRCGAITLDMMLKDLVIRPQLFLQSYYERVVSDTAIELMAEALAERSGREPNDEKQVWLKKAHEANTEKRKHTDIPDDRVPLL